MGHRQTLHDRLRPLQRISHKASFGQVLTPEPITLERGYTPVQCQSKRLSNLQHSQQEENPSAASLPPQPERGHRCAAPAQANQIHVCCSWQGLTDGRIISVRLHADTGSAHPNPVGSRFAPWRRWMREEKRTWRRQGSFQARSWYVGSMSKPLSGSYSALGVDSGSYIPCRKFSTSA